eukprot:2820275-Amphidinium_carterae.1
MRDIGRGDFNPDTTRSGRWKCEPPAETSSSDTDHQNDGTEYTEVDGSGVIFAAHVTTATIHK